MAQNRSKMLQIIPHRTKILADRACCFFFVLSIFSSFCSQAANTLTQGESLADGETLVSTGVVFELGFFSPGNSTLRYLGIWYHPNISAAQTVVWVANRAAPIRGSGGRLNLSTSGDLLLFDGANTIVWSSDSAAAANATITARIEDSGNLLLLPDAGGDALWQSFDHPTDTFLPGMKVGLNATTGKPQLFTAWRSAEDPSPGNYCLGLDPNGSAQIFIWESSGAPRWRSGQWNGHKFIGTAMRALYIYGFNFDTAGNYFTYTPYNSSLLRFMMGWDGVETTSILVSETKQWEAVWWQPSNDCELYGWCGDYGSCSYTGNASACSCLKGFVPRSSVQWSDGDWTEGCVRRTPLACELNSNNSSNSSSNGTGTDGFYKMVGVKLPDHADLMLGVQNENDCRQACLSNCSCKAYVYAKSDLGCLVWGRDLIDIYQFSEFDYSLNIKLAASELAEAETPTSSNKKNLVRIIVIVTTLGSTFLLLSCFLCWKFNARLTARSKKRKQQKNILPSAHLSGEVLSEFSGQSIRAEENQEGKGCELPLYTFQCIEIATNYFNDSNKLGEGGFGHVYKGTLPGGQEVAVKRLSRSSGQGMEEFKTELILISKLQHRNLVRLLGCCIEGEEKILIYEYLPNKSLDAILFDPSKKVVLDWKRRFSIIQGIARGLLYLHRDSRLRIVHRDLKASNILLDENMNPKISDFGMARIFGGDENQGTTNRVVGTFGYMSPEYAMEGFFSVRSDVYSFGVLVLEIVTGQRNSSFHRMVNGVSIVGHAWQMWNEDKAIELLDPLIRASSMTCQVSRCIHVALLCVQDRASDRPDIDTVIRMLNSEAGVLPMPRQPTFIAEGSPSVTEKIANKYESFSTYHVTITMLQGR